LKLNRGIDVEDRPDERDGKIAFLAITRTKLTFMLILSRQKKKVAGKATFWYGGT
jgi:hypothetical protein